MTHAALPGFTLTVPLIKIDIERRLVIGRAAREEQDKSKEIMDYATAKPMFQKWSDGYSMNQIPGAEMSKGNLRVMHSRNVAGKLTDLGFNDDEKSIDIICKVSDDNEWKKVMDGCYTGFSIGGGYAKKWQDNGLTRYTPDVREISLVDNPCMPSARIVELVKADGLVEQLELRGKPPAGFAAAWSARPRSFAEQWADRPVAPRTFAELVKAFDETKHKRDHGEFSSGDSEDSPLTVREQVLGGAIYGGAAMGAAFGVGSGHGAGQRAGRAIVRRAKTFRSEMSRAAAEADRKVLVLRGTTAGAVTLAHTLDVARKAGVPPNKASAYANRAAGLVMGAIAGQKPSPTVPGQKIRQLGLKTLRQAHPMQRFGLRLATLVSMRNRGVAGAALGLGVGVAAAVAGGMATKSREKHT
jgi:hypothetical protein